MEFPCPTNLIIFTQWRSEITIFIKTSVPLHVRRLKSISTWRWAHYSSETSVATRHLNSKTINIITAVRTLVGKDLEKAALCKWKFLYSWTWSCVSATEHVRFYKHEYCIIVTMTTTHYCSAYKAYCLQKKIFPGVFTATRVKGARVTKLKPHKSETVLFAMKLCYTHNHNIASRHKKS